MSSSKHVSDDDLLDLYEDQKYSTLVPADNLLSPTPPHPHVQQLSSQTDDDDGDDHDAGGGDSLTFRSCYELLTNLFQS